MPTEIHETTITKGTDGATVQLHIADAPIDDASATFRLTLFAKLPHYRAPYLVQIQREAILKAQEALRALDEALLQNLPPHALNRPVESR